MLYIRYHSSKVNTTVIIIEQRQFHNKSIPYKCFEIRYLTTIVSRRITLCGMMKKKRNKTQVFMKPSECDDIVVSFCLKSKFFIIICNLLSIVIGFVSVFIE